MYGAIFGFQRCWRWPKWAPASSSWRMENSGRAIDSVSFTGWPDARVSPFLKTLPLSRTLLGPPDGDAGTPCESHSRVRIGAAYRGAPAPRQVQDGRAVKESLTRVRFQPPVSSDCRSAG